MKYFVLPNSDQKQIFRDKVFVVKVPAMHCISYELEISWEKIFMALLGPMKSAKDFNLENFRLYGRYINIRRFIFKIYLRKPPQCLR